MGFAFACLLPVFSLLSLVTTQSGFAEVETKTLGGVTTLSYELNMPLYFAVACLAACGIGWFLTTKSMTRHVGWILLIGGVVAFFLVVPTWLQARITYDDEQVTRVMSRWFLPSTVEFRWEDVETVSVTDVAPNASKNSNKSYLRFILKDGKIVDWGNISKSPLVGKAIDEILAAAGRHNIPVEEKTVNKLE